MRTLAAHALRSLLLALTLDGCAAVTWNAADAAPREDASTADTGPEAAPDAGTDAAPDGLPEASAGRSCRGPAATVSINAPYPAALLDWLTGAVTFEATATRFGPELSPPQPNTVTLARLDAVLDDPSSFLPPFVGREVALLSGGPSDLARGQQAFFFAQTACVGNQTDCSGAGLSFRVLHRLDPAAYPNLPSALARARAFLSDRALYERMQSAVAIVVGEVRALEEPTQPPPTSEHSPLWRDALVQPSQTLCGAPDAPPVRVRFDSNAGPGGGRVTPLAVGQRLVLLLQPDPSGLSTRAWAVTEALDVQPESALARVQSLLARAPSLTL